MHPAGLRLLLQEGQINRGIYARNGHKLLISEHIQWGDVHQNTPQNMRFSKISPINQLADTFYAHRQTVQICHQTQLH